MDQTYHVPCVCGKFQKTWENISHVVCVKALLKALGHQTASRL